MSTDTGQSISLVLSLTKLGRTDLSLAGGKGANLGELVQAGFDVPPGFVITTAAYDLALESSGFHTQFPNLLVNLKPDDLTSVAAVSEKIRQALEQVIIPDSVAQEALDAYRQLGGAVAVRSSATAEDLPGAAFAGQQETFLNVLNEQAFLEAVKACWASLWSERAVLYRARQNVDQTSVKLAVVVQKMVPAEVAGVMFTANPISGTREELVIDASPGLGEAVVGGLATPDHFVLDKRRQSVKEQKIGKREIVIRAKSEGGTEQVTQDSEQEATASLHPEALRKLAQLGIAIERHYAAPQDIEWAWLADGTKIGKFLILQARPMTALPEPVKVSGPMRMIIPMLAEMWPVRPYPLDVTTFAGTLERAVGKFLVVMIGKSAPDPDKAFLEEDGVVLRFEPPEVHPSPGMLIAPWLALRRTRHYDPAHWQEDPILTEVVTRARELEARDLQCLTWAQNLEILHEDLTLIPRAMQLRERYFPHAILGLGGLVLLLALARRSDRLGVLLSGVETKTTETNRALEALATQIRSDAVLLDLFSDVKTGEIRSSLERSKTGRAFLERFASFLAEYGHRETALTISQGSWKDQPEIVIGILKVLATTQSQESDSYQAWKRTRDELLAHSILGAPLLRPVFLTALTNARCLIQMREDTHFYATLALPLVRQVALELGRRLEKVGALTEADDVFHLRLEELEGLGEPWPPPKGTIEQIRALAARRQVKRESLAGTPMVDPRLLAAASSTHLDEDVLLSGTPGSPGLASGPVRVVRDSSEFGKLQPGDILVAPVTNPAWTPLFLRAAAVVVDAGGSASHAAIVAREYGIPAVMGTITGTQQLIDGQHIRVDGSRGLVLKEKNPNEN